MKRMILPIVLVMLLGWVLVGCGPKEFDPEMPKDLKDHLNGISSGLANRVHVPADTNFDGWNELTVAEGDATVIAWVDADQEKWEAYKLLWNIPSGSSSVNSRLVVTTSKFHDIAVSGFKSARILFYESAGTADYWDYDVARGTILFVGIK